MQLTLESEMEKKYFGSFEKAIFNILILQTTANFPDIMLPSYKRNRALSLFFVIFLIFNNMIVLNLTLNVIYVYYKEIVSKNLERKMDSSVRIKTQASIQF